jgi:hypothetical protein
VWTVKRRPLRDLTVSAIGLGCMGMLRALDEAFPRGATAGDRFADMAAVEQ